MIIQMSEEPKKPLDKENLQSLNIMGDVYYTNFNKKYMKRQPWKQPDLNLVISFIPGTIREILVKEGDRVKQDQKLLVLEAMKMMNTIQAPFDGKIKSIKINIGDCIPKGTVMMELE